MFPFERQISFSYSSYRDSLTAAAKRAPNVLKASYTCALKLSSSYRHNAMIMLYLYRQSVANYINSVPVGSVPIGVLVYNDNPALCLSHAILMHIRYIQE